MLLSELKAYQAERLPSGLRRYGAPSGQHDDCVIALAIAWSSVSGQHLAVYPVPEADLIVPPFEIPAHWPRAYGLDVGWRGTAAIWGALDGASGVLYLYREYYSTDRTPSVHAQAISSGGAWIRGVMDPVGNGRQPMDGYRLTRMYRDLGLKLESAASLVDSGTLDVWQRMTTGRLRVFASLEHYLEELRCYRRDEGGQIPMEGHHLQNAARTLVSCGISRMRTEPVKDEFGCRYRDFSRGTWMGS